MVRDPDPAERERDDHEGFGGSNGLGGTGGAGSPLGTAGSNDSSGSVGSGGTAFRLASQDGSLSVSAYNNIFVADAATNSFGLSQCADTSVTSDYNDVYNWGGNYSGTGFSSGGNDISVNPLFVGAGTGNFHLQETSPCKDVGNNTTAGAPGDDLDEVVRPMDGDNNGTATIDMGVYEYEFDAEYTLTVTASPAAGGVSLTPDEAIYTYGDVVVLTPAPASGYVFDGWSGDDAGDLSDNGSGTWSIKMDEDKRVTANFVEGDSEDPESVESYLPMFIN